MSRVYVNYSLMRVKQKISFSCLLKNLTVIEIWFQQIIASFRFLRDSGQLPDCPVCPSEEEQLFKHILYGENNYCLKLIVKHNLNKQ